MATVAILAVVNIGLALLAESLRKDPSGGDFVRDDKPTTLAKRGSYAPLVIGRGRVGPVICWAGEREARRGRSSGGGKGGSRRRRKKKTTSITYFESGWHNICVGPADKLMRIFQDGSVVYNTEIDSVTTPSGSVIGVGAAGSFFWYWGEGGAPGDADEPPIDTYLEKPTRVGISSRWPHMVRAVWAKKKLGSSPRWPLLDYDLIVKPEEVLSAAPGWLGDDVGANPAHVILQILTANYPHGIGMPADAIDRDKLNDLATIAAAEGIGVNIIAKDGADAAKKLADILQDMSVTAPQVGRRMVFHAVRPAVAAIPTLGDAEIESKTPERVIKLGEKSADRAVFTFKDVNNRFRDMDLQVDNDGEAFQNGRVKTRKIGLPTIINSTVAIARVDQRQQEEVARVDAYTLEVIRGGRLISPGQLFIADGIGPLRCIRKKMDPQTSKVTLECMLDLYSVAATGFTPTVPTGQGQASPPAPDDPFRCFELPFDISGRAIEIAVARVRANAQVERAEVWLSPDDVTYTFTNNQDEYHSGGDLLDALPITDPFVIEEGPRIDAYRDISEILDLSTDELSWQSGRQIALINDEAFYLRNVTALGGNTYRLDGLIRARFDTERAAHSVSDEVLIFDRDDLTSIQDAMLQPNRLIYVKTVPGNFNTAVDIATVTADTKTIGGRALTPYPCENVRGNDFGFGEPLNAYASGGGIFVEWDYRVRDGRGNAVNEVPAGVPIGATIPEIDGKIVLEVVDLSGPTVVRTEEFDGSVFAERNTRSFFYKPGDVAADLGSPASFEIRLRQEDGAFASVDRSITISRVDPGTRVAFSGILSDSGEVLIGDAGTFIYGDPG